MKYYNPVIVAHNIELLSLQHYSMKVNNLSTIGGSAGGIIGYFWGRQRIISDYMSMVQAEQEGTEALWDAVRTEFINSGLWENYGTGVLAYMILGICTGSLIGSVIQTTLPMILGNTTGEDE
tara:strand:- start:48 stop:413 length:366 start_codon:yes stop_codon:yes gene_type:complete